MRRAPSPTTRGQRRFGSSSPAGGTLFLDDIDDMSLPTQVKLLRALQEREPERVGEIAVRVDIRVVVATKVDLRELVPREARRPLLADPGPGPLAGPPWSCRRRPPPGSHLLERHGGGRATPSPSLDHGPPGALSVAGERELENAAARSPPVGRMASPWRATTSSLPTPAGEGAAPGAPGDPPSGTCAPRARASTRARS